VQDEALRRLEFIKQKETIMADPIQWAAVPAEVCVCVCVCVCVYARAYKCKPLPTGKQFAFHS